MKSDSGLVTIDIYDTKIEGGDFDLFFYSVWMEKEVSTAFVFLPFQSAILPGEFMKIRRRGLSEGRFALLPVYFYASEPMEFLSIPDL